MEIVYIEHIHNKLTNEVNAINDHRAHLRYAPDIYIYIYVCVCVANMADSEH